MVSLPQYVGFNIRNIIDKYRRDNNIPEPDEVRKLYNRYDSFLEEELSYVTKLTINSDIVPYLEHFINVNEITIDSERGITQTDINNIINMFPNLKTLSILEQNNLQIIDVSSLSQLEELIITSNRELKNIVGIDKLKKLYSLTIYDNQTLSETSVNQIVEQAYRLIDELGSSCNLDVLYMPEFLEYLDKNGIVLDSVKDFIVWSEHLKSGVEFNKNDITHTTNELYVAYKKALDIVSKYINPTDTPEQRYAILYHWMCENVKYDYEAINSGRINSLNGIAQGRPRGINGTVNALVYGSCVCQGYTKAMELLLKLSDIHSFDISCRAGEIENDISEYPTIYDGKIHANDSNHSIIKVNLGGKVYYSDVTWDAERYQSGEERKYFLLSQSDISKNHLLYNEDNIINDSKSISKEEQDRLLKFAIERIKSVNMKLENQRQSPSQEKTSLEFLAQYTSELKNLQEQYDVVAKKIEDLMKQNSQSSIPDFQKQLGALIKQKDEISKKMEPVLESKRTFQRLVNEEKQSKHRTVISQVEQLLSITISSTNGFLYDANNLNGVPQLESKDTSTLRQELVDIHKRLDDLYNEGKIDTNNWQTMKNAVSNEYERFISESLKSKTTQRQSEATNADNSTSTRQDEPFMRSFTHEDAEWEAIKLKYNFDSLSPEKQRIIEQQFHDMFFRRMMEQIGVDDNLFETDLEQEQVIEQDVERRNIR